MQHLWVQSASIHPMATTLHVRDVPEDLHAILSARAERQGMSLRCYVLSVLSEHAALPTIDEWLDDLSRMPPVSLKESGAAAVRAARDADDEEVLSAHGGR